MKVATYTTVALLAFFVLFPVALAAIYYCAHTLGLWWIGSIGMWWDYWFRVMASLNAQ